MCAHYIIDTRWLIVVAAAVVVVVVLCSIVIGMLWPRSSVVKRPNVHIRCSLVRISFHEHMYNNKQEM